MVGKMNIEEAELYQNICEFRLDNPTDLFPFTVKLAWEYRWTEIYTLRATIEYKKFVFLATIADRLVSPSMTIDRVWHSHLLYTYTYWHDFCGEVLHKPLHHYPGGGGADELVKDRQRYQDTLALYQTYFGTPPTDIWDSLPLTGNHLAQKQRDQKYWIIPESWMNWFR